MLRRVAPLAELAGRISGTDEKTNAISADKTARIKAALGNAK